MTTKEELEVIFADLKSKNPDMSFEQLVPLFKSKVLELAFNTTFNEKEGHLKP